MRGAATLGGWREEWETTGFVFDLSADGANRHRARLRVGQSRETRVTIQYEIVGHEIIPALPYDSAHGQPHRDTLDRRGRVVHKQWLPGKDFAEVVTEAIDDIKANWAIHRVRFEREDG